jgi:CRP-like cAMP-binding protein
MSETLKPQQNQLLAALPAEALERITPFLEAVPLSLGEVLYDSGVAERWVYFPVDSIVSLLNLTNNGASAEIAVVGKEGMVGIAVFLGGKSNLCRAVVQSAGYAYRLLGKRLADEVNQHGAMLSLLLHYTQALFTLTAQTAICNRHHSIDQQLCRWLLLSFDRLSDNHLVMTQELIANMLGVRREGVTEAAGRLQRQGVIEYHRGHITVLDRPKLERLSCDCYQIVKMETERLLHYA